jgi:hypothetical protein
LSVEQVGFGAGGGIISGIIATILVGLGLRERIKCLEDGKLSKDVFHEYRGGVEATLKKLDEKVDRMDIKLDLILKK